ncbi:glycosyltransferase family 39 protein [Hymenobacter tibetensis]|uniref:Glycosyltransferase family 39 protein n=1 Tax=Hymenobacter tibetensis TaxID=497967 RepID=A0ABY4D2X8_9BACT|nr:glycosyltransferase family 39 protein [Hymenobacter tibetensis]UOG75855.1 glycosyltransferase family 39 protein [Hymenobacter tibetensis]
MLRTSKQMNVDFIERDILLASLNKNYQRILLTVIIIGAFLRVFHFFDNRSLWIDELYLNVNLIKMNFIDLLTKPMDYQQKAPLGYLWMTKLSVLLFGKGERALRLSSLVGGIASILLFVPVARFFLKPWSVIIAVGILAFGEPFVYYTTEAKQYGIELLASVLALYLFVKFQHRLEVKHLLLWGITGGILVWFSNSSIFVLAGIGIVVSCNLLLKGEWKSLFFKLIPFGMWLVSFALVYFLFLRNYADSGWLKDFFETGCNAFLPLFSPLSENIEWFAYTHYILLERNLGMLVKFGKNIVGPDIKDYSTVQTFFRLPFLPILLELVGVVALFRRNKYRLFILVVPIALTLVASAFKAYPFFERLIIFLAPLFILLISYGAQVTAEAFGRRNRNLVASILVLLLLFPPTWNAIRFTVAPDRLLKKEYNREAMLYVNDRYKEGDAVYVYWNVNHAYKYYKEAYNLKYDAVGRDDLRHATATKQEYYDKVRQQFGDLSDKKRIWIVHSPELRNNIGDYVSPHLRTPKWYYNENFSPGKELEKIAHEFGAAPIDSFHRQNISGHNIMVKLYVLNK